MLTSISNTMTFQIYLTFSTYELNKPNDCDSNFIEIYEENLTEENQTVKFCGTRTEPQQSKSNVFNIRHHALPTASGSRFIIIYTAFRDKGPDGKPLSVCLFSLPVAVILALGLCLFVGAFRALNRNLI